MKKQLVTLLLALTAGSANARISDMSADQALMCAGHFTALATRLTDNRAVQSAVNLSRQLKTYGRSNYPPGTEQLAEDTYRRQRDFDLMLLANGAGDQVAASVDQCLDSVRR